jgi:hypothetical protein
VKGRVESVGFRRAAGGGKCWGRGLFDLGETVEQDEGLVVLAFSRFPTTAPRRLVSRRSSSMVDEGELLPSRRMFFRAG